MDIFKPLQITADWISLDLLGLDPQTRLESAINFFLYDSAKIIILLLIVNFFMAAIKHYIPTEKLRDFLASRKWFGLDHFLASIFGTITPFCSCSSIPLFAGFLRAGVPLGVTLSFLITSPLVNQAVIVMFAAIFGWKIALLYLGSSVFLGTFTGFILGKMKLESQVEEFVRKNKSGKDQADFPRKTPLELFSLFWKEGTSFTKKIVLYVLLGIGLGSLIHGYVPAGFFEKSLSTGNFWAVPAATIAAIPFYANAVGVIPILDSLVSKGAPLGTGLAFMMATAGLSLPEALILKKVMKLKLLLFFFGTTALNIIALGYLFNFIFG